MDLHKPLGRREAFMLKRFNSGLTCRWQQREISGAARAMTDLVAEIVALRVSGLSEPENLRPAGLRA